LTGCIKLIIERECTIITGDKDKAGTDMQITITLFGTSGTSSPTILEKGGNRFERGNEDLINLFIYCLKCEGLGGSMS
jgi:hypothetical protein